MAELWVFDGGAELPRIGIRGLTSFVLPLDGVAIVAPFGAFMGCWLTVGGLLLMLAHQPLTAVKDKIAAVKIVAEKICIVTSY
ncbi:hypothetical protein [Rhodoplanes sp. Z2-YC6860]|uniref:hypothetical protein n=1 Tax=Rhodoplanes sp. Z2-YC6860 TaxID=674703 RepID=UPI000833BAD3|nr:hypothetical protein [Rhodoplanes sp. Z2-YC6860]